MKSKDCVKCGSDMIVQSYIDPVTQVSINQDVCLNCGYSEPTFDAVE